MYKTLPQHTSSTSGMEVVVSNLECIRLIDCLRLLSQAMIVVTMMR